MGNLTLNGATSGQITLAPTAVAGTNTLTLPATTGTVLTNSSPAITTPTITGSILNASGRPMVAQTGGILQTVFASTSTGTTTTSQTFVSTSLSGSITPSSTSSKILVICQLSVGVSPQGGVGLQLTRGGSSIFNPSFVDTTNRYYTFYTSSTSGGYSVVPINYLDSPASTSAQTYAVQVSSYNGTCTAYFNSGASQSTATSTMILMEIAQ